MTHRNFVRGSTLLAVLLTIGCASGCPKSAFSLRNEPNLIVEKTTTVVLLPPDSNKVEILYVYEGISVMGNFKKAVQELEDWKKSNSAGFTKLVVFQDLHFFIHLKRERTLCAHRRALVDDRNVLAKEVNKSLNEFLARSATNSDEENRKLLQVFCQLCKSPLNGKKNGTLSFVGQLLELVSQLDNDSLRQITASARKDFAWMRYEPHTIRLVLPVTQERAKKIVNDPNTPKWIDEAKKHVQPIRLEICPEGLAILLGKKGEPLRIIQADERRHQEDLEPTLIKSAGNPQPALINGKNANAEMLIEQFVKDVAPR